MKLTRAAETYPSGKCRCDICRESFQGSRLIYHCPRGKTLAHSGGSDICKTCAMNQGQMSNNNSDDESVESLFSTFSSISKPQLSHNLLKCDCGGTLRLDNATTISSQCYEGSTNIGCDLCHREIKPNERAYHCQRGRNQTHPGGYDLCEFCGENYSVAKRTTLVLRQRLGAYQREYGKQKHKIAQLEVFMHCKLEINVFADTVYTVCCVLCPLPTSTDL